MNNFPYIQMQCSNTFLNRRSPYVGGRGMCHPSGVHFEDTCSLRVHFFCQFLLCSLRYSFKPHSKLCVPPGYTNLTLFDHILCSLRVRVRYSGRQNPVHLGTTPPPPPPPPPPTPPTPPSGQETPILPMIDSLHEIYL